MTPPTEAFSDDYDVEENNAGVGDTFSIDDDDECVIEDVDDEDSDEDSVDHRVSMSKMFRDDDFDDCNIHDQLPSVEEVKASNAYLPTARLVAQGNRRKLYLVIAAAALAAMVLSVSITVGVFKRANKTPTKLEHVMKTSNYDEVANYIFEAGVTDLPDFRISGTPESYACAFMASGDTYDDVLTMDDPVGRRRFLERYILVVLYYKASGQNWFEDNEFLQPIDHCRWHKQYSTPQGRFLKGVQCNGDGFVVDLDLSSNNLVLDYIPEEIQYLKYLERLHLYGNSVSGVLPDGLKKLTNLKSLGLMDLELSGTIPNFIGEMVSLTTLALSNTKMASTIPSNFANLRNLRVLGMDGMGLKGSMNSLSRLEKLEALYLEDNFITSLPENLNWPSMIELDLSNNILNGSFNNYLLEIPNLIVLDLNSNYLTGAFPTRYLENNALQYLSLHDNGISGTISDRIGFLNNLRHLDISANLIEGTLPDTIQLLNKMVSLTTSGNKFNRQRLDETYFTSMSELQDLSMKENQFSGSLPENFAGLSKLRMLDLDRNDLIGTIPSQYGMLEKLTILQLNRNQLSGTVPSELSRLDKLQVLLLDGNDLFGNTKELCAADGPKLKHFTSDCYPGLNNERGPEVECRCCTLCCNDENKDCNDHDWTSSYDLKAEYGYIRTSYEFTLDENKLKEDWKEEILYESQVPPPETPSGNND